MELTRHFGGGEAPLVGLLRVYKDYYPDVIIGDAVAGRAKVFTVSPKSYDRIFETKSSIASQPRVATEACCDPRLEHREITVWSHWL